MTDDGMLYRLVTEAIGRRPLLGAGAGSFEILFPSLRTTDLSSCGVWDYAHSTILEIAFEMGVPVAGMVVLAALASLFILVRRALKADQRHRVSLAAIVGNRGDDVPSFIDRLFAADTGLRHSLWNSHRLWLGRCHGRSIQPQEQAIWRNERRRVNVRRDGRAGGLSADASGKITRRSGYLSADLIVRSICDSTSPRGLISNQYRASLVDWIFTH